MPETMEISDAAKSGDGSTQNARSPANPRWSSVRGLQTCRDCLVSALGCLQVLWLGGIFLGEVGLGAAEVGIKVDAKFQCCRLSHSRPQCRGARSLGSKAVDKALVLAR